MAETIERDRPDLNLLIPREDAGCPFSESATVKSVFEIRRRDPNAFVVADAKALGPVKDLADSLAPIDLDPIYWNNKSLNNRLYILPGGALSGEREGSGFSSGVCEVHAQLELSALAKVKRERPEALVVVNVLCRDEVKARADKVGDSQAIWDFCAESPAREFIVASEVGLAESLALTFSHKRFYDPGAEIFCPNMKLTNLKDLIAVLESYQLRAGLLTRFGARTADGRLNHDISG
jgi:quinolinate synthase